MAKLCIRGQLNRRHEAAIDFEVGITCRDQHVSRFRVEGAERSLR